MKKSILFLSISLLVNIALSQDFNLELKSGYFSVSENLQTGITEIGDYRMLFFKELPNESEKLELQKKGVDFLYYLPTNIFVVYLNNNLSFKDFERYNIQSCNKFLPEYKIDNKLKKKEFPKWAISENTLFVKMLLFRNITISEKLEEIRLFTNTIENVNEFSYSVTVGVDINNLNLLSELNYVSYIEPIDPPALKENDLGRTLHRTNVIDTEYNTGRKYNGDGVNVMMHDDGYVEPHIDRKGRVDEQFCNSCSSSSGDSHGDHVSGTIMGAGNLDPKGRGMADGAFLYVLNYTTNNYYNYVPNLYSSYDVVITTASYSNGCNAGYTSLASDLDEQNNVYPSLLHVFSAGNSGSSDCGYGAGSGWGNVTGGHKQAKNVIAVGNLDYKSDLASSSSRGPAADGRIKPDICAQGTNVYSTYPNYTYQSITGTSMACPGISGVLAQLYQAYKESNNGNNPPSALMKCILLNTADDIGNPGPDFQHGWGQVNAFRATKVIENSNYLTSSVSQGGTNNHNLTIPSGLSQVKLMIYWHDKEGNTSASTSLVNDLNFSVTSPTGSNFLPYVLNPSPSSTSLNQNATNGIDYLNNMEQIVLNNPISGNYDLQVSGWTVPYGPQEYFISYEFISDDVEITYPIGGEGLVPGEYLVIRWDAIDNNQNFTIEYSNNNGATWNTISNSVSSDLNHYVWTIPNAITNQAKIRVSRGNTISESNDVFTIVDVPTNLSVFWPCPDSIYVSWNSVSGASSYEVSMLGQKYMDSIYSTNLTSTWIINPTPSIMDSWFSVKAIVNGGKGRRAVAVNAQSQNNVCSGYGCTDPNAFNYSSLAIVNDGSCCYIAGCTDVTAINYDSLACFDDGSCIAPILGCTNPLSPNYDPNANTTLAYGGALDNTFGNGGYFNGNQHLIFDATKECVIKSAMIYSEASNNITFELRNSVGNVIDDTTLNISSGQQRIDLNFEVPVATDMQLGVANNALQTYGLYRNNNQGALPSYPYNIASAINITASSASTAPTGYYYFYYDIEVETPCNIPATPSWDCDGQGNCYDPGTGNGQYTSLNACQSNCIVSSWDCDGQGNCYDPGTGNGQYTSLNACQSSCIVPSWDCDGQGSCYDPGTGNGQYTSLNACQSNCIVLSWDCDGQGNCYDPGTGNGQYTSLNACQSNCIVPSWDCDGQGNCYDPGTGNGQYTSLNACQSSCIVPSWDCDGQGNCYDPGTGNGQYTSLNACQSNCIVPSWDCDGQGNCYDPGTGLGLYSSLSSCESECVHVSVNEIGLNNLLIYPNPSQDIFNLELSTNNISDINIRITNLVGEIIYSNSINKFSGTYNQSIDLRMYSKGVYLFELNTENGSVNKKLILQ